MQSITKSSIVALCGGVGGVKLAWGLYKLVPQERFIIVANTGDDFEHFGLHISPDIDTIVYTLAGLNDPKKGWGRADETWRFMSALELLGGECWFGLGDSDLATHVQRTNRLRLGETLTAITNDFTQRMGVKARVLPMSNESVRTILHTREGTLPFQQYFVKMACHPVVTAISFDKASSAQANPLVLEALADQKLGGVILCPSNPYLSIDPILAVPGMKKALMRCTAPIVAVSPIIGGRAVKGPTAKIMTELGIPITVQSIAHHYAEILDGLVIDESDAEKLVTLDLPCRVGKILMSNRADQLRVARLVLSFLDYLRGKQH